MSNDMFTNGVDISGLHLLTFSMQIIVLDDYSHKNTQKPLYRYNLGKISMPRIPKHLRERAIGMLEAGASTEEVSVQVGLSVQTRSTEDLPCSGRPQVTTSRVKTRVLRQRAERAFSIVRFMKNGIPSFA